MCLKVLSSFGGHSLPTLPISFNPLDFSLTVAHDVKVRTNKINMIFISIPSQNVLDVVEELTRFYTKDKILFIDTPIIGPIKPICAISH